MNKICCVGDANICSKSSSCSMVLRSVCSHRHSPEHSTTKNKSLSFSSRKSQHSSAVSKKDSSNGSLNHLKLSLHKISTDFCESFEVSNSSSENIISETSLNVLSVLKNSSVLNTLSSKECSNYSNHTNNFESLPSTSNMPEPRRFSRSSLRGFSDDEYENSDITIDRISRTSSRTSSQRNIHTQQTESQSLLSNYASAVDGNHSNFSRGSSDGDHMSRVSESSHLDQSSVQYSLFDKFRWFFWRYTYLMIIRFVNFDVWVLSRMYSYGKRRIILIVLLLPLLFYLFYFLPQNAQAHREVLQVVTSVPSYISAFVSSAYGYFKLPKTEVISTSSDGSSCTDSSAFESFSQFSPMLAFISNIKERVFSISNEENHQETVYHPDEDSFHLINRQISSLKSEIESLKLHLKSMVSKSERDKQLESYAKLHSEMRAFDEKFESLSRTTDNLDGFLKQTQKKEEMLQHTVDQINIKLKTLEEKFGSLDHLKSSGDKQWSQQDFEQLEKYLILAFKNIVNDSDNSKYQFINEWINSKVSDHEELLKQFVNEALKRQLSHMESKINYENIVKDVKITVLKHIESLKQNLSESKRLDCARFSQDLFAEDKVKKIVNEAIKLYDADKTGQVDYALESGGGSVVGTRCSETYVEKSGTMSIFGVPLWTISNSPRTAIQPDVQPGRCWAFKGSHGFLVVELSATIYPTGFTLEHIPVSLSPTGSIDSAPKNFSVWGLDSDKDNKGFLLGEYSYDSNNSPLQYFVVQKPSEKPYSHIELKIHSNHGNLEYTCLYRFRVHGKRVQ